MTAEEYALRVENQGDFGLFNALDQIIGQMDFACNVENFAQKLSENGNNVYRYDICFLQLMQILEIIILVATICLLRQIS